MHVAAPSALAAVQFAGGWIVDRVMAGWDVAAFIPDPVDAGPLRIVGADVYVLDSVVALTRGWPPPKAIAVAAELVDHDGVVKDLVRQALQDVLIEIVVWGSSQSSGGRPSTGPVEHDLSHAARAFKAHALAAAGVDSSAGPTEAFHELTRI